MTPGTMAGRSAQAVDRDAVFPVALGAVERAVGKTQELVGGRLGGVGARRDADTHRHLARVAQVRAEPAAVFREADADALGGGAGLFEVGLGQDDDELVATDPAGHVRRPAVGLEYLRGELQDPIARGVADRVVERFKPVHVDDQQRQVTVVAHRRGVALLERLGQRPAVGDLGERIGRGDRLQLTHQGLELLVADLQLREGRGELHLQPGVLLADRVDREVLVDQHRELFELALVHHQVVVGPVVHREQGVVDLRSAPRIDQHDHRQVRAFEQHLLKHPIDRGVAQLEVAQQKVGLGQVFLERLREGLHRMDRSAVVLLVDRGGDAIGRGLPAAQHHQPPGAGVAVEHSAEVGWQWIHSNAPPQDTIKTRSQLIARRPGPAYTYLVLLSTLRRGGSRQPRGDFTRRGGTRGAASRGPGRLRITARWPAPAGAWRRRGG